MPFARANDTTTSQTGGVTCIFSALDPVSKGVKKKLTRPQQPQSAHFRMHSASHQAQGPSPSPNPNPPKPSNPKASSISGICALKSDILMRWLWPCITRKGAKRAFAGKGRGECDWSKEVRKLRRKVRERGFESQKRRKGVGEET